MFQRFNQKCLQFETVNFSTTNKAQYPFHTIEQYMVKWHLSYFYFLLQLGSDKNES